jgi:hypothetical protein
MSEVEILVAEIKKNLEVADRLRNFIDITELHELAMLGKTPATALMMASMIENYYTCLETMFLRISQSFENHLDEKRWHQTLLDRMTLQEVSKPCSMVYWKRRDSLEKTKLNSITIL